MELTKIADSNCKDGDCPTVYRTDRGTIGVQGAYLTWRDAGWRAAVPFRDYWAGLASRV